MDPANQPCYCWCKSNSCNGRFLDLYNYKLHQKQDKLASNEVCYSYTSKCEVLLYQQVIETLADELFEMTVTEAPVSNSGNVILGQPTSIPVAAEAGYISATQLTPVQ